MTSPAIDDQMASDRFELNQPSTSKFNKEGKTNVPENFFSNSSRDELSPRL